MIWAILAALGVPLWLCAIGIFMLLFNNRRLRKRYGDVPVRVRRPREEALDPRSRNLGLRRLRMARKSGGVERGTALGPRRHATSGRPRGAQEAAPPR